MTAEPRSPSIPSSTDDEVQIDLMRSLVRIVRGYKVIVCCIVVGFCLSVGLALYLPKVYTAEAVFMPPVSPESAQAASLLLHQDSSDLYLGMLKSRSVADSVTDSVHLMQRLHLPNRLLARQVLQGASKFGVEQNSLISVRITTGDPHLAADIANAYLEALYKLNGEMSASSSSHRREFFEQQLSSEKEALSEAEAQMKQFEEKTGTVLPESEAQAGLSATARLQASIEDAEARLSSLLTSSTEENPQVITLRAQIDALKAQLRSQQLNSRPAAGIGITPSAQMPGVLLDYLRSSRDLKEKEALYDSLMQQYERARLASLDPGPELEVVDHAEVPMHKSGPPRTEIVILGTFLGGVIGILLLLLKGPARFLLRRYQAAAAAMPKDGV